MNVSFIGCSNKTVGSVVLHFLRIRKGLLKVVPREDADIVVLGEEATNCDILPQEGEKLRVVRCGKQSRVEGNVMEIPQDQWRASLAPTLEAIAFERTGEIGHGPKAAEPAEEYVFEENLARSRRETSSKSRSSGNGGEPAGSFDPEQYSLLADLREAHDRDLFIHFDDNRFIALIDGLAYCHISKGALKNLSRTKEDIKTWYVKSLDPKSARAFLQEFGSLSDITVTPVDKLIWNLSHYIASGRLASDLDTEEKISINHWPDFCRVETGRDYLRIATLLANKAFSANELINREQCRPEQVYNFLFAARQCRYVGRGLSSLPGTDAGKLGVVRKLINKLNLAS